MSWQQAKFTLAAKSRGFHLITDDILKQLPEIHNYQVGLLHLFLQHTSASLTINENADPTVRMDMESHFNHFVPERQPYYKHDYEGDDDMPAHIKSSTLGCQITIPISHGRLMLGTWQGVYLGEHRDYAGGRSIIATLSGELY
ncbi:secondary thiamine-phosphate synthase enzyme YjbQ [Pseudoalteromonas sp. SS15]|jgi:secondary thiamine-phosphate synthase enzyme|uniref:secondary thiamine-phosphate synthase enzyme YjbQ n=1 Tax=Pseudoalteromonas sp. SS15 TaxID=3139393 RepID=UPI003BAA5145